jgi:hypothetical protein
MISAERIMRLLKEGKTTSDIQALLVCSKSSIIRIAKANGHTFRETRLDWEFGDCMIKDGFRDEAVAEEVGCSIASARRRRTHHHGMKRGYVAPDPQFNYREALEKTFKNLHQKFFPCVSYENFRQWCRTDIGQVWLDLILNKPERYTEQHPDAVCSIHQGGRYGAHA